MQRQPKDGETLVCGFGELWDPDVSLGNSPVCGFGELEESGMWVLSLGGPQTVSLRATGCSVRLMHREPPRHRHSPSGLTPKERGQKAGVSPRVFRVRA